MSDWNNVDNGNMEWRFDVGDVGVVEIGEMMDEMHGTVNPFCKICESDVVDFDELDEFVSMESFCKL